MKKILVGVVTVLIVLLAILLGGGFLLSDTMALATEQRLKSAPAQIFPVLTTHAGIVRWSKPWLGAEADNVVVKKQSAQDEGVGLVITWESKTGDVFETWTVSEVVPPTRVVYDVDFAGMMKTKRVIQLTPAASLGPFEGCDAHWQETATLANPVFRWMTLMFDMNEVIENRNVALRALDAAVGKVSP